MTASRLFILILFFTIILRLFKLAQIPPGFANDEGAITYQAYSILKTGKDTWNNPYPFFSFRDFGEYLPVFSVYFQIPFLAILGLNEFAARLPFALTSIAMACIIYLLTLELFQKKSIALIASFLFAVSPLNIGWSRFVYEGNFGSIFYLLGMFFYTKAKRDDQLYKYSIFFFGLTYATYHIYYFLTTVTLGILYLPILKELYIKKKKILRQIVLVGLFFALYSLSTIASGSGRERFRQVSIFTKQEILQNINTNRNTCAQNLPDYLCRLFFNKPIGYFSEYSFNYLSHFSPQFLAINGTFLRQAILPPHGLIYPFELIFFFFAIAYLFIKRVFASFILLTWLLLYPAANSFTGLGEISRIGHIMPLFPILSALGIYQLFKFIKIKYRKIYLIGLVIFAAFNIITFLIAYFIIFPKTNSQIGSYAYVVLFKKINRENLMYENYYITRDYMGFSPEFQARIFVPIEPEIFQDKEMHEFVIKEPTRYIDYNRLNNYHFFQNIEDVNPSENDLIVLGKNQIKNDINSLFEIKEPRGEVSLIAVSYSEFSKLKNEK